jgi:hypothetical protein
MGGLLARRFILQRSIRILGARTKESSMSTAVPARTHSFRSRLASFAAMLEGARDCAAAVEAGRRPSDRALSSLGIDAAHWDRFGSR